MSYWTENYEWVIYNDFYTNWKWANTVVNSYIDNLWKIPIIQNIPMLPETWIYLYVASCTEFIIQY